MLLLPAALGGVGARLPRVYRARTPRPVRAWRADHEVITPLALQAVGRACGARTVAAKPGVPGLSVNLSGNCTGRRHTGTRYRPGS